MSDESTNFCKGITKDGKPPRWRVASAISMPTLIRPESLARRAAAGTATR
jgi:hypothetical protein